ADGHPQRETHIIRKRVVWLVPVLLGDRVPRCDRSIEEKEAWAETMLILFRPWRKPEDLKLRDESWIEAYDNYAPQIPKEHLTIIENMNVLSECKDARDQATRVRR
ncbi:hypothetical protein C8Q76DRAFT_595920, partial [Earliella scabrosa]